MMELVLKRTYFNDATLGCLYILGQDNPVFYTIEKPWKENQKLISCIPERTYEVLPYSSPKFPDVWELQNVSNRDKILIHKGNYEHDLQGCIAIGLASGYMYYEKEQKKAVTSSGLAVSELKRLTKYPKPFRLAIIH
jgi:hypothetical protein